MQLIPQFMLVLFIASWVVAAISHIYATRYFIPRWWSGFRKRPQHVGYGKKIVVGYGIFFASIMMMFLAGAIAEQFGGWG